MNEALEKAISLNYFKKGDHINWIVASNEDNENFELEFFKKEC
jgi:hypothetical protein